MISIRFGSKTWTKLNHIIYWLCYSLSFILELGHTLKIARKKRKEEKGNSKLELNRPEPYFRFRSLFGLEHAHISYISVWFRYRGNPNRTEPLTSLNKGLGFCKNIANCSKNLQAARNIRLSGVDAQAKGAKKGFDTMWKCLNPS